jgi:hypothetical protein
MKRPTSWRISIARSPTVPSRADILSSNLGDERDPGPDIELPPVIGEPVVVILARLASAFFASYAAIEEFLDSRRSTGKRTCDHIKREI